MLYERRDLEMQEKRITTKIKQLSAKNDMKSGECHVNSTPAVHVSL